MLGLQAEAKREKLPLVVGVHEPVAKDSGKVRNTCLYIDGNGEIKERYVSFPLFALIYVSFCEVRV